MDPNEAPPSEEKIEGLKLGQVGEELSVPAGTRIVSQGEAPEYFYIIQSGRVRVFREKKDRKDHIRVDLTTLEDGAYFGEVALVTGLPRTASVEASTDCRLIRISKSEFDEFLDKNPQLARHIIKQLAHWLVTSDVRIEDEVVHQVKLRQISWFDYVLMVSLSIIFALVFNLYNDNKISLIHGSGQETAVAEIPLIQAQELYQRNAALFVDARKPNFYEQQHIKGAMTLATVLFDVYFEMFKFTWAQAEGAKDKILIVYGGSPSRRFDLELARLLKHKGFERVTVLGGGPDAWQHAFPLEGKAKLAASLPLGLPGYLEWMPVGIFLLICIPVFRRSPYLSVACRVLLGVIFMQFALSKIMRPAVFALNVVDYGMMPAWGVNLWALVLPWGELIAGLFLALGIRTRAAATLIGGMNLIFIVGLVNALYFNLPINCGCVGEAGEPVTWWKVLKNMGMLVMTIQIFLYDRFLVLDRGGFIWREKKI